MTTVSYIITNSGTINLVINGKPHSVAEDHSNYNAIIAALKAKEYENLVSLIDVSETIRTSIAKSSGSTKVELKNGLIYYNGFITDNTLTRRILTMIKKGYPIDPMIRFLENLMENPSSRAIQELYSFMDANNMPITEDGYMLVYKRVGENWKDMWTGTFDNSVGKTVKEDRALVCADSNQTCAKGLHFCSLDFLPSYHGGQGRAIIIKIHPKDVVSIPTSYSEGKGRCCEYVVVGEHAPTGNIREDEVIDAFKEPVYASDGSVVVREDEEQDSGKDDCGCDGWGCEFCEDECEFLESEDEDEDVDTKHVTEYRDLSRKPDGTPYWNVRNKSGQFTKRG